MSLVLFVCLAFFLFGAFYHVISKETPLEKLFREELEELKKVKQRKEKQ